MLKNRNWMLAFYLVIFGAVNLLIAVAVLPEWLAYPAIALNCLAIAFFDSEYALFSVVLSIPFYVVLPNRVFDSFSGWRIAFVALFLKVLFESVKAAGAPIQGWKSIKLAWSKLKFSSWDGYAFWLLAIMLISLIPAPFKFVGLKKIAFVLNIYLLYASIRSIIKEASQARRLIYATLISLALIVLMGFVQLGFFLSNPTYYFWQYWAVLISKSYYGLTLADTLTYSNSWFSFVGSQPSGLRMFSVLPDSHAFGLVAMFSIPYAIAAFSMAQKRAWKWSAAVFVFFAALGVMLSGTRGIWAGLLLPVLVLLFLIIKRYGRRIALKILIPIAVFLVLLAASPLIQKGFSYISSRSIGNSFSRAESIYDLNETSNKGRIKIWQETLDYISSHPLLGSGFGNFISSLDSGASVQNVSFDQVANQKERQFNLPKRYVTGHSLYLDILAELGILGFVFFILYILGILKKFWSFFVSHRLFAGDPLIFFVFHIGIYTLWLLGYSFFDGALLNDRVLMYFFINIALSASIMEAEDRIESRI